MNIRKKLSLALAVIILSTLCFGTSNGVSAASNNKDKITKNFINVNGENIYYERKGNNKNKDTIIFIHGALVNSESMKFLSEKFNDYNCITFDLPGHGKSEGTPKMSIADYTESVYNFIDILKAKNEITNNITLVGWSMGGSIALELAEKGLKDLKNIVLLDSSAKWVIDLSGADPNAPLDFAPLFQSNFTSLTPQYVKDVFMKNASKYLSSDLACKSDLFAAHAYDNVSELSKVNVPVLILSGDVDNLALIEYETLLKKNIKNSYLKIYPNRAHIMFMEIPDQISKDIREFFTYSK